MNGIHDLINILQIVFLENIFLALTDEEKVEKVNRERDNADMSEHSNNQLSKKNPGINKENEKCS